MVVFNMHVLFLYFRTLQTVSREKSSSCRFPLQELWICFNNMNIIKDIATSTPILKKRLQSNSVYSKCKWLFQLSRLTNILHFDCLCWCMSLLALQKKRTNFRLEMSFILPSLFQWTESYTLELLQVTQTESFHLISKKQVMKVLIRRLLVDPITNSISRQQVKLLVTSQGWKG